MNVTLETELSTLQKSSYGTQHNRCLDFSASRQSGSLRVMLAAMREQDVRTYFAYFLIRWSVHNHIGEDFGVDQPTQGKK